MIAQLLCAGGFGGAEAVACALARAQAAAGLPVLVYALGEARVGPEALQAFYARIEAEAGVPVRRFDVRGRVDVATGRAVRAQLRHDAVTVAHAHAYKAALYAGLPPRAHRLAFTVHGFDQTSLPGRTLLAGYTATAMALADAVTAVDPITAQRARRLGRRRVEVIPNAIASAPPVDRAAARQALAARLGLRPDAPWLLWVGRLVPIKRPEAALRLAEALPEAELLIAGDGPLAPRLHAAPPGNVHFLGHVSDLAPVYASADLLLNTSASEGCPMTALEAMSFGCPVVAPAVGGVPDVVCDGVTGAVYRPESHRDALAALRPLIADPELARRWGAAGRRRAAAQFSFARWVDQHAAIYAR